MTETASSRPLKVLFIVGAGRSGSTLLDQVLGEIDGFFSIGELNAIWGPGLIEGEACGCGSPLRECPFWHTVIQEVFEQHAPPTEDIVRQVDRHVRARPRQIGAIRRATRATGEATPAANYASLLSRLYSSIASTANASVLVDSTKLPAHALLVRSFCHSVELYVLHLVRDPRAVTYSWLRNPDAGNRAAQGDVSFRPMGAISSILHWLHRNISSELLLRRTPSGRFMQLRYEDFVADPSTCIADLLEFVDEPRSRSPFLSSDELEIGENHIVAGNRAKHRRGRITVINDAEWKEKMSPAARLACAALTFPFLVRYHYFRTSRNRGVDTSECFTARRSSSSSSQDSSQCAAERH